MAAKKKGSNNAGSSLLTRVINSSVAAKAGVPQGYPLRRFDPTKPSLDGLLVLGGAGRFSQEIRQALQADYEIAGPEFQLASETKRAALVFDATALRSLEDLCELYTFIHPQLRHLQPSARVVVIGAEPGELDGEARIVARALEGFTRSLAKEMRKGGTVQLVYVAQGVETLAPLESTLRFLLSGKSAFVDGQIIRVGTQDATPAENWHAPLEGRLALVTGAARGIGATIAEVLARDGAQVICVDVPGASEHLSATANKVKGTALPLDVTAEDAAQQIAEHAQSRYGRSIDVLVHNAGITRDKLLVNMSEQQWDQVLAVNLMAPVRITQSLLDSGDLAEGAAVIGVSSMAGISGNRGQTNYATTKAGIIGLVDALRGPLAAQGSTINAVAPGFIETAMTDAMPTGPREIGKRMNSLQQGGKPVDVAETVAFFAQRASSAVSGNVVRVCGQNIMGA
ncbi:3-oxoacyl-ACP reductase [Corynebacterium gerontici]|uniref:3-oxoacyl-[acyl-carrier-protein] reductase FabG n=1 Tax=Corynebacterium gerontici TaxID=2079234 RepID=A0A3G6IYY3_9CORY|nr:3-oxoacyl-ACP reductase [Corynebacterium gerontici]AZA10713.1 3-oxoacyl-[acyl-carrier-protein] reductase FabG [Corynebacterium gerontici]